MKNYLMALTIVFLFVLTGCGGDSNKDIKTKENNSSTKTGVFIDNTVSGIKYINAGKDGFTNEKGEFPYENGSIEFYLGKIKLGEIDNLTDDGNVFVQDIVGVERTNTSDFKVLKIATLLQSLDSDKNTDIIEIKTSDFQKFEDTEILIDNIDVNTLLNKKGFDVVLEEEVKRHLTNVLKEYGIEDENSENNNIENISIKNIETAIGEESKIAITFNGDVKKDAVSKDIFKLTNNQNAVINYELSHVYNKVIITTKEKQNSFDGSILDIKVSQLKGYGVEGSKTDLRIKLGSVESSESLVDITPPVLKSEVDFGNKLISTSRIYTFSGIVKDNTEIKKVVLEVNGKETQIEVKDNKFSLKSDLKTGINTFKLSAEDTSGNKTSITSSGNIFYGSTTAAGGAHSGAIKNDKLYTWGRNNFGQTGLGYTSKLKDETNGSHPISPKSITTPTKFVSLSFMQNFSTAIDENGDVYSWGYDKNGELGRGIENRDSCSKTEDCRLDIGKIESLSNIVALDAGLSHTLALNKDGEVWAFGSNGNGELGNGTTNSDAIPVKVAFPQDDIKIIQVTAGSDFSVALDENGDIWAWGKNNYGQMAQGSKGEDQLTPIKVTIENNEKVKSIAAGTGHILVLTQTGEVYGWGNNATSQVGYNGYQYKGKEDAWDRSIYTPKKILDNDKDNPIINVYAGGNSSYILRADNKVYPWGQYGETDSDGKQSYNNLDFPEDKLTAITSVKDIAAGALHIAAIQQDDTVFTWRWSYEGSLGGGESTFNIWFYNYPIKPQFPQE